MIKYIGQEKARFRSIRKDGTFCRCLGKIEHYDMSDAAVSYKRNCIMFTALISLVLVY